MPITMGHGMVRRFSIGAGRCRKRHGTLAAVPRSELFIRNLIVSVVVHILEGSHDPFLLPWIDSCKPIWPILGICFEQPLTQRGDRDGLLFGPISSPSVELVE